MNSETFWRFNRANFKPLGIEPYLEEANFQNKTWFATGFTGCVWKCSHSRRKQVQVGTVRAILTGVNTKIALDTGRQILYQPGSNDKYILPLQHMLKVFENKDPLLVKKLAVHPDLPYWLCKWGHRKWSSPHHQVVGDLEMISFYYLLRIGEYTAPKWQGQQPRTKQSLVNDITFFKLSNT